MKKAALFLIFALFTSQAWSETEEDPLATYEGLAQAIENKTPDLMIIDLREFSDFQAGHIPTAVNIPVNNLIYKPPTKDLKKTLVVYCRFGNLSNRAVTILESMGYKRIIPFGRIIKWKGPRVKS